MMKLMYCIIFILAAGYIHVGGTSTNSPVNRGAARQMYGSASLRETGSAATVISTTELPHHQDNLKEHENSKNHITPDQKHNYPVQKNTEHLTNIHGYNGDPDFYPGFLNPERDFDESLDVPSYRNGAPVNGGFYGQGKSGNLGKSIFERPRSGVYGSYDNGGYGELPDRVRIHHGLSRGHGINPSGNADLQSHSGQGEKTLIHELDDESELNNGYAWYTCASKCTMEQFLCITTCTCINLDHRCDGSIDCENGEDEMECEEIFEARRGNETCRGESKILCPESGLCISQQWLCDGDNDCGDYSDESNCGNKRNCTTDQFECRDKLCIPQLWRCDGEKDCPDYSDEENCNGQRQCKPYEFACPYIGGPCILKRFLCDGEDDCADGSDEFACHGIHEVFCDSNHFECRTPKCIRKEYRCDGTDDCGDGSDEEDCFGICSSNELKCINGSCISHSLVCNGHWDCKYGDDEVGCKDFTLAKNTTCIPDEFSCPTGECIPHSWVCDGVPDCPNARDEDECPDICPTSQYLCKASSVRNNSSSSINHLIIPFTHFYCISKKRLCDGFPDCPLKDDEKDCPTKRKCTANDKCTQQCILTSNNEDACACDTGFILGPDNFTCLDINECEFQREPVCSQLCNNTIGSFMCECITGYVLRPDLRTCKAIGGNPTIIFANRVEIRQMGLESYSSSKYNSIIKGLYNAVGLDYDYKNGLIYWSDISLDTINRVNMNGSHSEVVIHSGVGSSGGIAIDWIHNLLFWTNEKNRRIGVLTLDTKIGYLLIYQDIDKPRAIAVHPHYGYIFWTEWGPNPRIERADMDGTGRVHIIRDSITWPNGLCIDYSTDRLYWTEAKHRIIMSANLDGTDKKKIISRGLHHPFAITVFEDSIYWTDWHLKSIYTANKKTGRDFKVIQSNLHFPMDIQVYHKQRQPTYANHCGENNGKCSHICLPNSKGFSCACPIGLTLNRTTNTCTLEDFLILARKNELRLIDSYVSPLKRDAIIPVDNVRSAVALAWDRQEEDMIYWTDVELNSISRAHLNGTNQSFVINNNLESPAGLALDWIGRKLYWTDAGTNRIECSNLDGSMRALLIYQDLDKPRDIVVDPTTGYMYWSDWGAKPKIERAAMNGDDRQVIIGENVMWPNGLSIDFKDKRLYWADGGMKSIEYLELKGNRKRVRRLSELSHPFGLVVHKNDIYWTDWDTKSIHHVHKDKGKSINVIKSNISGLMDVRLFHRDRTIVPNPCAKDNGKCSHLCLLAPESIQPQKYSCVCPIGLILEPNSDNKQCRKMPNDFIIFAHRIDIRFISFDTDYRVDVVIPLDSFVNTTGVDVDRKTGEIYWTDPGEDVISRASFDGSRIENIITSGIDTVDSMVIDSIGRKIYWTDAGLNSIEVAELNGSNRKVLIGSGLDNPRAIALHYAKGLLFWTDWGQNARIERANMDGNERMAIITENLVWPNGLSIDVINNKLYWNDAERKVIEVSELDGSHRKVIIKNVQHPYGLSVMGDYIYWSDWMTKSIHQANKNTGKDSKIIVSKLDGIMDIRVVNFHDIDNLENLCGNNNGGCSHLCLRNPRGYSCACPTGILLMDDQKTCQNSPNNFLLITGQKSLAQISLDTPELRDVDLHLNVHQVDSVDFHWKKNLIIYTDNLKKNDVYLRYVRTVNIHNMSDIKTVIAERSDSFYQIAVDWLANNLYLVDQRKNTIEVVKLDGSSRKCLINETVNNSYQWFSSIILFPKYGYMFWSQWGKHVNIQRAYLDGSNRKVIISSDLLDPNGLSIDYENKKLYWADMKSNRIEMSDLNGNYRVQLIAAANNPFGLTQLGEFIYWIGQIGNNPVLMRVDKATGRNRISIRTSVNLVTNIKAVSSDIQQGWSPCVIDNGGCSHLCLFTKRNYTCACPDVKETNCSTIPNKQVPLRQPGKIYDPDDEYNEDEKPFEVIPKITSHKDNDEKFRNIKNNKDKTYTTMTITIGIITTITIIIFVAIIYLICQRKPKQEKYNYSSRRNVLTFSNPNYSADIGANNSQSENRFILKRIKRERPQERVYEDNGHTSSPEVVSLIPPTATPSSSRAPSITPRDSPTSIRIS
ncbi:LOW QUALITY PROTEIN: low-density lipoprotein receptor-related protein 4 [Chelonus insularis]|uniref:LOW QUALITY PROTEIN: low-density lipoprotein receptor-related protein 4 n=1 Tax=Chelonus insularis TaxID=460826 RepID=UPI00158ECB14|nr:LOW QUALITY PROTEIN: low-density lipoprotein receptor-related protein 4 [Chelonus insularis]